MKKLYIYIILFQIFIGNLFSQSNDVLKKEIVLGEILPYKTAENKAIENKLYQYLADQLSNKSYSILDQRKLNKEKTIEYAKQAKASFVVTGYYSRKSNEHNLEMYLHIYDPASGKLIDIVSVSSILAGLEGIELDKEELKENDEIIISQASEKTIKKILSNPNRKERRETIDSEIENHEIYKEVKLNLEKEDITKKADDVFKLINEAEVVTASRTKESLLNTPASMVVISEDEIKTRGYTSLDEIFYDLPGFDITFGNGSNYLVGYQRGYRTPYMTRTLFMIDNKVQNEMYSQVAEISRQIPITNVKRVEVLYGPASAVYGPNAFQGIINVLTHDGKGKGTDYSVFKTSLQAGSFNTRSIDAGTHAKVGDWSFAISGKIFKSDDPDISNRGGFFSDYWVKNPKVWGPLLFHNKDNKMGFRDPADDWGTMANISNGGLKIGMIVSSKREGYGTQYPGDRSRVEAQWENYNRQAYVEYDKEINKKVSSYTLLTYRQTGFRGQWGEAEPDWNPGRADYSYVSFTNWNTINNGWLLNQNFEYKFTENLKTMVGVRFEKREFTKNFDIPGYWPGGYSSWNNYNGKTGVDLSSTYPNGFGVQSSSDLIYLAPPNPSNRMPKHNTVQVGDVGGFGVVTYDIGKFRFSPGVRYDQNSIYGHSINPRITGIYKYSTNGAIKVLYGEAFQEPSFLLLYGGWQGRSANPNMKPEKARTGEIIVMHQFSNVLSELSTYYSKYENVIKEEAENAGSRKIYGLEFRNKIFTSNPIPSSSKLTFYFYYTFTEALSSIYYNYGARKTDWTPSGKAGWVEGETILGKYENDFYALNPGIPPLPRTVKKYYTLGDIARHKISLGMNIPVFDKLNINLRGSYVGPKELYLRNQLRYKGDFAQRDKGIILDPYFLLNASVSYNLGFSTIVFKVFNLLNHTYYHPGMEQADAGDDYYNRSLGYKTSILAQPERYFLMALNCEF